MKRSTARHKARQQLPFTKSHAKFRTAVAIAIVISASAHPRRIALATGEPRDNPVANCKLRRTSRIKWSNVALVTAYQGETFEERLSKAQAAIASEGGGAVYFPPGIYKFRESLYLMDGLVLRGARPEGVLDARDSRYSLPTRFEFPKYIPSFQADGTPIDKAFKGIYLEDPSRASNCGLVNVAINRGHINFQEAPDHKCGRNRLIYGCVLSNAAVADPRVPDAQTGQHAWQRFTNRHHAAIINNANAKCDNNTGYQETKK